MWARSSATAFLTNHRPSSGRCRLEDQPSRLFCAARPVLSIDSLMVVYVTFCAQPELMPDVQLSICKYPLIKLQIFLLNVFPIDHSRQKVVPVVKDVQSPEMRQSYARRPGTISLPSKVSHGS